VWLHLACVLLLAVLNFVSRRNPRCNVDGSILWQGVMSEAIPWKLLQDQYFSDSSYEDEIAKLVHSPEDVCCCCITSISSFSE